MLEIVHGAVESWVAESGGSRPALDRFLCLDVSNRRIDGWCYLFFDARGASPVLVAKAARTPDGKAVFASEFDNLVQLERAGLNRERQTTPSPFHVFRAGPWQVTLQSALQGTLMKNLPGRRLFSEASARDSVGRVYGWWSAFQSALGVSRKQLDRPTYEARVLGPLRKFRQRFLLEPAEEDFLRTRYDEQRVLEGTDLPFMVRHADFCTANMVWTEPGIGVFDWEFAFDPQTPLFDLFFFFSSLRFPYRGRSGESDHFTSFLSVFWKPGYLGDVMRECIGRACREFRIPGQAVGDLLVWSLIQTANMKYEALIKAHGMQEPDPSGPARSRSEKLATWESFDTEDKNVPFARIRSGRLENLAAVVEHGIPEIA